MLKIDCSEAVNICNKAQYNEASGWQKLKLRLHNAYCKNCRSHSSKNGKLTKLCSEAKLTTMDPAKKEDLKKKIIAEVHQDQ